MLSEANLFPRPMSLMGQFGAFPYSSHLVTVKSIVKVKKIVWNKYGRKRTEKNRKGVTEERKGDIVGL